MLCFVNNGTLHYCVNKPIANKNWTKATGNRNWNVRHWVLNGWAETERQTRDKDNRRQRKQKGEDVDEIIELYQYFSIEQSPGLTLKNFTAVDDFYCRTATQTLKIKMKEFDFSSLRPNMCSKKMCNKWPKATEDMYVHLGCATYCSKNWTLPFLCSSLLCQSNGHLSVRLSLLSSASASYLRAGQFGLSEHQGGGVDGVSQLLLHLFVGLGCITNPEGTRKKAQTWKSCN